MKTKKALLLDLLAKNISLFRCPICMSELSYNNDSLICSKRHLFDISKKKVLFYYIKSTKRKLIVFILKNYLKTVDVLLRLDSIQKFITILVN